MRAGRHPPGPPRARHRLGRDPAPARRPRHRRGAADVRPPRPGGPRRAGTSAASRSRTRSTPRSSSTGGRRSPSRSTGRPRSSRWPSCGAGTSSPARAASSSASTTRCSTRRRSTKRASRSRARARCSPRSNATAPAAWATSSPRSRPSRTKRSAPTSPASLVVGGRAGHRQDRGRAAPRRVPPLHVPAPARRAGRAARRPEPGVPALHRARAPVARRAGRAALDDLGPASRSCASSRPSPDRSPRSRATRAWRGSSQRAVADRERPLRTRLHRRDRRAARPRVAARDTARVVEGVQRRRGTHNEQPPATSRGASSTSSSRATRPRRSARTSERSRSTRRPTTSRASSTATPRSTRAIAGALARGERCPKVGSRSCARASAAGPR